MFGEEERDTALLRKLKSHPLLRARLESLLAVEEDAAVALEKADAAEKRGD